MKKLNVYILLLCILIVGCKQQESTEETRIENEKEAGEEISRETFAMDVTGSKDIYTVEMTEYRRDTVDDETEEDSHIIVSIYAGEMQTKPIQTFDYPIYSGIFGDYDTVDANFDGYKDFYYVSERGNVNYTCKFFLWDGEKKEFVESTVFNDISMPTFDVERKVVEGYWHDSAASNVTKYYKYMDGILTCIRILDMRYPTLNEDDTQSQQLVVKDYKEGELITVFDEQAILDEGFEGPVYDAFFKWKDIDYTGEE